MSNVTQTSPKGKKPSKKATTKVVLKQLVGTDLGTKSLKAIRIGIPSGYQPEGFLKKAESLKELRSLGRKIGFDAKTLKGFGKTKKDVRELRSLVSPQIHWDEVPISKKSSPKVRVTGGKVDLALIPANDTPAPTKSPKVTRAKKTKTEPTIHEVNAKLEKLINVVEKVLLAQA